MSPKTCFTPQGRRFRCFKPYWGLQIKNETTAPRKIHIPNVYFMKESQIIDFDCLNYFSLGNFRHLLGSEAILPVQRPRHNYYLRKSKTFQVDIFILRENKLARLCFLGNNRQKILSDFELWSVLQEIPLM